MLTDAELNELTREQRAAYESGSFNDRMLFGRTYRANRANRAGASGTKLQSSAMDSQANAPASLMRVFGIIGTVVTACCALVAGMAATGTYADGSIVWVMIWSSLMGLFAFMWMLGAIEHRLIQINETLKKRP